MQDILEKCILSMEEESEKAKSYNDLMETISRDIDRIDGIDSANDMIKKLKEYDHIWDSRVRAWAMIQDKTSEIALKFDPETKKFVQDLEAAC
jgi:hypothetical protein